MGRAPETHREAQAALREVRRVRAQPWWRSEAATHAAVWLVGWPVANTLIGGASLSPELIMTSVALALVLFVFAFWMNRHRTDRMERQAQALLSRLDNLEDERRWARRYGPAGGRRPDAPDGTSG